jgi:hypothetical protein
MRILWCISIVFFLEHSLLAQPVLQVEGGYWHFPVIDEIFQAYKLAHPWTDKKVEPLGIGAGLAIGWNQQIFAPRGLHAIGLAHYRYQATALQNSSAPLHAGFHQTCAELLIRSHPRCLLKDVQQTGPLGTRWYIQLGGGYSWNLPFASKYGEQVYINNNEKYRSISGQMHLTSGTGWHALTIGSLIITLETTLTWYPRFELDSFATAVLGHNEPSFSETAYNSMLIQGHLRLTYRKKSKNWWDAPRSGDKS